MSNQKIESGKGSVSGALRGVDASYDANGLPIAGRCDCLATDRFALPWQWRCWWRSVRRRTKLAGARRRARRRRALLLEATGALDRRRAG